MADEKKRIRRSKKEILTIKLAAANEKVADLKAKLEKAEANVAKFTEELAMVDNVELRKAKEQEQKKIAQFIKEKGLSLEELEALLNK